MNVTKNITTIKNTLEKYFGQMIKKIDGVELISIPHPRVEERVINGMNYNSYIIGEIKMSETGQECQSVEEGSTTVRGFITKGKTDTYKFDSEARYFNYLELKISDSKVTLTKKQAEAIMSIVEEFIATCEKIKAKEDLRMAESDIQDIKRHRNEAKTNDRDR